INKIFDGNVNVIQETKKIVRSEEILKSIDLIKQSKRIIFFGIGGSSNVAIDAQHKFVRTGKYTNVVTYPHKQMILASITTSDDLIIAISHEGINRDLNEVLKTAKKNKSKIISITQFSNSTITQISDVNLYTISTSYKYRPESLVSRVAA